MGKLPGVIEPGRRPRQAMARLGGGVTDDTVVAAMAVASPMTNEGTQQRPTERMHARQTGDVHA